MSGYRQSRAPGRGPVTWITGQDGTRRPQLAVDVHADSDGEVLITADGEIDLHTEPLLREALFTALAHDSAHTVLVDMAGVTFLDSTGINALVHAHRAATGSNRTVRLCNPQPLVTRVLRITGLEQMFGLPDGDGRAVTD
jgi:anti-sigma B factor antagonist